MSVAFSVDKTAVRRVSRWLNDVFGLLMKVKKSSYR